MSQLRSIIFAMLLALGLAACATASSPTKNGAVDFLRHFKTAKLTAIDAEFVDAQGKLHDIETLVEIAQLSRDLSEGADKYSHPKLDGQKRVFLGKLSLEFTDRPDVDDIEVYAYPDLGVAEIMYMTVPDSNVTRIENGVEIFTKAFAL